MALQGCQGPEVYVKGPSQLTGHHPKVIGRPRALKGCQGPEVCQGPIQSHRTSSQSLLEGQCFIWISGAQSFVKDPSHSQDIIPEFLRRSMALQGCQGPDVCQGPIPTHRASSQSLLEGRGLHSLGCQSQDVCQGPTITYRNPSQCLKGIPED
jgi:hypothetical protein